jgi:hypothetical protein
MVNIYLDDIRPAPEGFLLARNPKEFWELFHQHKGNIDILSFDHDLGEKYHTGYYILKSLVEYCVECPCDVWPRVFNFHTDNPVGMQNMIQLILANKPAKVTVMKFKHHRR